jgi:ribulose bisphosphate carboxylase small subunit
MTDVELSITRLDRELRSLEREASLAIQSGKTATSIASILTEYVQLTEHEEIIPAVQYIVLDGLARNFELYQDDRERSRILAAMAAELDSSIESDILVSLQIVRYTFPALYQVSQELIDLTQARALECLTKLPNRVQQIAVTPDAANNILTAEIEPEIELFPLRQKANLEPNHDFTPPLTSSIKSAPQHHLPKTIPQKIVYGTKVIARSIFRLVRAIFHFTIVGTILFFSIFWEALTNAASRKSQITK